MLHEAGKPLGRGGIDFANMGKAAGSTRGAKAGTGAAPSRSRRKQRRLTIRDVNFDLLRGQGQGGEEDLEAVGLSAVDLADI